MDNDCEKSEHLKLIIYGSQVGDLKRIGPNLSEN